MSVSGQTQSITLFPSVPQILMTKLFLFYHFLLIKKNLFHNIYLFQGMPFL